MAIGTGLALLGSAIIGGVSSHASTKAITNANNKAVAANATAANTAIANNNAAVQNATGLITNSYNTAQGNITQAQNNLQPWQQVGLSALAAMASVHGFQLPDSLKALAPKGEMGGFFESPDYKYRVDQGTKAITAQAASRGLLDSGATGKALVRFGQQEASREFGNWYNRLAGAVGLGQTATAQGNQLLLAGANAAQNYGQTIADLTTLNARNNGLITLDQGRIAGNAAIQNGQANSGLISNLGGIGAGLLSNWPSSGAMPQPQTGGLSGTSYLDTLQQVGVNPAGLLNTSKDWRMGPPP